VARDARDRPPPLTALTFPPPVLSQVIDLPRVHRRVVDLTVVDPQEIWRLPCRIPVCCRLHRVDLLIAHGVIAARVNVRAAFLVSDFLELAPDLSVDDALEHICGP
jgi:hypothetical protein